MTKQLNNEHVWKLRDLAQAKLMAEREATCTWTEDNVGAYNSACGEFFEFTEDHNEGGPAENGALFCQYCGKKIVVVAYMPESEDDDE